MDDTNKNLENFALDVIRFLQKWGLWRDVCIYTGGKAYRYDDDSSSSYKTIPNVKYEEGVDPEDYMKGLTPSDFEDVYVVTGHTPTQTIKENPKPGFIYRNNNHIAIDCGRIIRVEDLLRYV